MRLRFSVQPGDMVRVIHGEEIRQDPYVIGSYAIVIRLIPQEEIRLRKGFPCGRWFDIFVDGDLKQVRQDCLEGL